MKHQPTMCKNTFLYSINQNASNYQEMPSGPEHTVCLRPPPAMIVHIRKASVWERKQWCPRSGLRPQTLGISKGHQKCLALSCPQTSFAVAKIFFPAKATEEWEHEQMLALKHGPLGDVSTVHSHRKPRHSRASDSHPSCLAEKWTFLAHRLSGPRRLVSGTVCGRSRFRCC